MGKSRDLESELASERFQDAKMGEVTRQKKEGGGVDNEPVVISFFHKCVKMHGLEVCVILSGS